MFYLSKITADDPSIHNLDFKPIRFEKIRDFISKEEWMLNRYPLYYGPVIKKYRLEDLSKESGIHFNDEFGSGITLLTHFKEKMGPQTLISLKAIYFCIEEMVSNNYFFKTNLINFRTSSFKDRNLFARYIFETSNVRTVGGKINLKESLLNWHTDFPETPGYIWTVNLGENSTLYDTRYRIKALKEKLKDGVLSGKFPRPQSHEMKHVPRDRVVGMHGTILHSAPYIVSDKPLKRFAVFFFHEFDYLGEKERFKLWKLKANNKPQDNFFN